MAEGDPRTRRWGLVTARDIMRRDMVTGEGSAPRSDGDEAWGFERETSDEATAADVMTADVLSVPGDAGLRDIAVFGAEKCIHRVLVKDAGGYAGVLSTMKILDTLSA